MYSTSIKHSKNVAMLTQFPNNVSAYNSQNTILHQCTLLQVSIICLPLLSHLHFPILWFSFWPLSGKVFLYLFSFLFVPVQCTWIRAPSSYQYSSLTSAFSSLSYLPVTVKEPETVIGKIPSEHKRMTVTHSPRVMFSNNLRFPSPLSFSKSISFSLSVYIPSLRIWF